MRRRSVGRFRTEKPQIAVDDSFLMKHIDNLCNPLMKQGEWIAMQDIVLRNLQLVLVDQARPTCGQCNG